MKQQLTDLQKQWIAMLRSGKYTQGQAYLCQIENGQVDELFCCLGVACELMGLSRMPSRTVRSNTAYAYIFSKEPFVTNDSDLGHDAFDKLGLYGPHGPVADDSIDEAMQILNLDPEQLDPDELCLTWLNDHGFDFKQIADLLETYPHWFFTQ